MTEKLEPESYQQQPYDSALKALFEEQASEVIRILLQGAEYVQELSSEALKPPLRADRVYLIREEEELEIAHFEDERMVYWFRETFCYASVVTWSFFRTFHHDNNRRQAEDQKEND